MEVDQILSRIRNEWQREMDNSALIRDLMTKVSQGKATYADAQDVAIKAGDALSDLFRRYLPDALVDGRLPEEIADKLIRQLLMDTYKLASSQAADVQRSLNQAADIGIDAVVPDPNVDQIDGIIHGISTARDYHHYEESFLDQVENFPEGVVDDTVRANADFQYHAGLSPTIERKTDGKCCPWCSRLAGTYPYEDVRNAGNDVFRRHRNCHCQVLFNPGDGSKRRQNVHSRQWTEEERDARINLAGRKAERLQIASPNITNLQKEYVGRSVGAKFRNYDILDLRTGEIFHLAEGTFLDKKKVFAGKGSKSEYRDAFKFADRFGGNEKDWQHVKGIGTIEYYGENREAEVHWSQCEGIGKFDFFIKEWLD